ncbi:alpha/beta hydrolase family esterase [Actinoplanes sp. NPDC020271]|uniref:alpha/beta hydrolase family esterase n=1 Tax=Actinoplanes sp. NPDC020271 TaxID=3363896 RepID=UPI00378EDA9A
MLHDSVEVDGRTRTYTVTGGPSANLVLVFHGSKQTGPVHRDFTGRIFDTVPAVVVYLDGYRRNWNDARRESRFPARIENVDDVAFTRAVIAKLVVSHGVDPAKVFAVGYSNGGQMVMRLAHEQPALLAGATVIAATLPEAESFLLAGAAPVPLPVLLIHGTKDPIVRYQGGGMSWFTRAVFKVGGRSLSMPETAAYFAARNGITATPVSARVPAAAAVPAATAKPGATSTAIAGPPAAKARTWVERTEYRQAGRPPVALYTVHGGGHTIPGPRRAPAAFVVGETNSDVNTAELVTEFFGLAR